MHINSFKKTASKVDKKHLVVLLLVNLAIATILAVLFGVINDGDAKVHKDESKRTFKLINLLVASVFVVVAIVMAWHFLTTAAQITNYYYYLGAALGLVAIAALYVTYKNWKAL